MDLIKEKNLQSFQATFSVKNGGAVVENADGTVSVRGYASTNSLDSYNDIVEADVWKKKKTLSRYKKNPVILYQHNSKLAVGTTDKLETTEKGLYINATIKHNDEGVIDKIKSGTIGSFSIGFAVTHYVYVDKEGNVLYIYKDGKETVLDEKWYEKIDKNVIKGLELYEISVVSVPANSNSVFTLQKSIKGFFLDQMKKEDESSSDSIEYATKKDMEILISKLEAMEKANEEVEEKAETGDCNDSQSDEVKEEDEKEVEEVEEEKVEEDSLEEPEEETKKEVEEKSMKIKELGKKLETKGSEVMELKEYSKLLEKRVDQLNEIIDKTPVQKGVSFTQKQEGNSTLKAFLNAKNGETANI